MRNNQVTGPGTAVPGGGARGNGSGRIGHGEIQYPDGSDSFPLGRAGRPGRRRPPSAATGEEAGRNGTVRRRFGPWKAATSGRFDPLYNVVVELLAWIASILGFLATTAYFAWDWLRSHRGVRVSTDEVPGPTTTEYGFSQSSVRVVIANKSGTAVQIQDIRLMFARRFGAPLVKAPPPRENPELPAAIEPGTATTWYFPAETLAIMLGNLSSESPKKRSDAKLRARVATATGRVYRGRRLTFSLDPNKHWL